MTESLIGQTSPPEIDPNKNYIEELVGEGKKYKTVEDLAKSRIHADIHIQRLESENADITKNFIKQREENVARAELKELIDQLKTRQLTSNEQPQVNEGTKAPAIDMNQFESLITTKIQQSKELDKQQENYNLVKNKLQERYGNNYSSVVEDKMKSLGINEEFLNNMARNHPQVLLKTLEVDEPKQESFQAPAQSGRRPDSFKPTVQKRNWTYYENIRKSQPSLYWDSNTQKQLHDDYALQGAEFGMPL
jgi:hypothetical protein